MRINDEIKEIWIGDREVIEIRLGAVTIWRKGQNIAPYEISELEEENARKTSG